MRIFKAFIRNVPVLQNSMLPTIHHGDRIISISSVLVTLKRGDVVVFNYDQETMSIKRIVGLPGEHVSISQGQVLINGAALKEEGVNRDTSDLEPMIIPRGSYFVLGDNRPVSKDSRVFGPVKMNDIRFRALAVYRPIKNLKLL